MHDTARWYSWDGKRYTFYMEIPRNLSARELIYNVRLLRLIDRQLRREIGDVRWQAATNHAVVSPLVAASAAASILAKVTRDREMTALEADYPGYGFAQHKGYPTKKHLAALQLLGPCAIHRRSFAPVAKLIL